MYDFSPLGPIHATSKVVAHIWDTLRFRGQTRNPMLDNLVHNDHLLPLKHK